MKNTFEIKQYHLNLVKRLWLTWDDYSEIDTISVYSKKPYGNSDYLNDIKKEVGYECSTEFLKQVHKEIKTVLEICLSRLEFKTGKYFFTDNKWFTINELNNI